MQKQFDEKTVLNEIRIIRKIPLFNGWRNLSKFSGAAVFNKPNVSKEIQLA